MQTWQKHLGGGFVVAFYWFVAGFALGMGMEVVDPSGKWADIWPAVFAIPGFFGGLVFYVVLSIAERRRRYSEISISRAAVWGAVSGLVLPVLLAGLALLPADGLFFLLVTGVTTVGCAIAGGATVAVARRMVSAF